MMRKFFLAMALSAAVFRLSAETRHAGASMELGVGARSLALGGYVAALYGSADNFHSNPAAGGLVLQPAVSMMYAPTFGKLSDPMAMYHYLGVVAPLFGNAAIGLHWTRFFVDDIPIYPKLNGQGFADRLNDVTLRPDGTALGYFQDTEDVFYISFARSFRQLIPMSWLYGDLPVEIPIGLNIKILRQSLYRNHASGLGLDLGAMIKFSMERLLDVDFLGDVTLAFSSLDVTQTPVVWDTRHEDRVRRTVLFGLGYRENFGKPDAGVQLFYTRYKKYQTAHLVGLEAMYRGLALRFGTSPQGWNLGAGLRWRRVTVDYAFTAIDFSDAHRISCSFSLVKKKAL
jgi:hypothetical protein